MRAALLALAVFAAASSASRPGVLLLAHGGSPEWNADVARIAAALDRRQPTELALGMADADAIQSALDRLGRRQVSRVVAVPLFIDSHSEVLDQTRYVLGLRDKPSETLIKAMDALPPEAMRVMHAMNHGAMPRFDQRAKTSLPVVMTSALDDDPLVEEIALDRARALSRAPARETVFLVAHGPVDERANGQWLGTIGRVAAAVKRGGRFKDAQAATIRDDSPPAVKQAAIADLRRRVAAASASGGAIVVPYLISRGGIEDHITSALSGLRYAWDGRTLSPDPRLTQWAQRRVAAARR